MCFKLKTMQIYSIDFKKSRYPKKLSKIVDNALMVKCMRVPYEIPFRNVRSVFRLLSR